jgi:putative ABC transport system permease protein
VSEWLAFAQANPAIDIQFKLLRTQIRNSLTQDELMATLCGFFGGLAVLLAAVGLYGVISYTVAQRTNEIGIRMALGAQRSGVLRLILGEIAVLIGIGIIVGGALTLASSKVASSLLFGLAARDPVTLTAAAVLFAGIGFAASFVSTGMDNPPTPQFRFATEGVFCCVSAQTANACEGF